MATVPLYILAGQSQGEGLSPEAQMDPKFDAAPYTLGSTSLYVFNQTAYDIDSTTGWEVLEHDSSGGGTTNNACVLGISVGEDTIEETPFFGPEMSLCEKILQHHEQLGDPVVLVTKMTIPDCPMGARLPNPTPLTGWPFLGDGDRAEEWSTTPTEGSFNLYEILSFGLFPSAFNGIPGWINRLHKGEDSAGSQFAGASYDVRGVFWCGNESDAEDVSQLSEWGPSYTDPPPAGGVSKNADECVANLTAFIHALRVRFKSRWGTTWGDDPDAPTEALVPFIIAKITHLLPTSGSQIRNFPHRDTVRAAQQTVADNFGTAKNVDIYDPLDDFPNMALLGDGIHYDGAASELLGYRLWQKWWYLQNSQVQAGASGEVASAGEVSTATPARGEVAHATVEEGEIAAAVPARGEIAAAGVAAGQVS